MMRVDRPWNKKIRIYRIDESNIIKILIIILKHIWQIQRD